MLRKDLAAQLGISGAMVSRLAKRGMPTDSLERAHRWRKRHLEPGRIKGARFDPVDDLPSPSLAQQDKATTAAAATPNMSLAALMLKTAEVAARGLMIFLRTEGRELQSDALANLRNCLRLLPKDAQPRMSLAVWIALVDYVIRDDEPIRSSEQQSILLSPDGFGDILAFQFAGFTGAEWLRAACDPDECALAAGQDEDEENEGV